MTRLFSPILYPLACLALLGFHLAGITRVLNPGTQFLLAAFLFFFLPGDILTRRIFGFCPSGLPVRLLAAFLGGLSLHAVVAWILMMFGGSFTAFQHLAPAAVIALIAVSFVQEFARSRKKRAGSSPGPNGEVFRMHLPAAILVAALLISVFFFLSPGTINPTGDAFDHIGYARRIVADNALAPADVVAPAAGGAGVKHDPRKGALHPILALWGESAGLDPAILWTYLPVVLAPAAFLSFVLFSFIILPGAGYVLAATALFVLFQGGIGREYLAAIAYGQNLSLVFLWTLAAFCIVYLRRERRVPLGMILFLIAGGALIHFGFLVQLCLFVLSMVLFGAYLRFDRRALFIFTLCVSIVAGAIFIWKMVFSYGQANIMHMHPQGVLYVGSSRFIVSPIEVLRADSLVFLGGIVLLPGLFFIKSRRSEARLCIALSALPVLICFNPLCAPFVFGKATYLLHRLLLIVPSFQIIALVFGTVLARGKKARILLKAAAVIILFLWIKVFVLPGRGAVTESVRSISFNFNRGEPAPAFQEVIKKASQAIPDNSVVISDPITSYAISAYRNIDVVSVLHQHGNPNDPLVMERLAASRDVLSSFVPQRESLRCLERFKVDYIVINGGFSRPVHEFMADWSSALVPEVREKYFGPRDNFEVVYDSPDVVVVRVLGYYLEKETWMPTIPYLSAGGDGLHPCGRSVSGGGAAVRGVAVMPQEVLPGETVRFTIQFEKDLAVESPLPVKLIVRFDNVEYISRFASYPGGKHIRRMKERMEGFLSRHRTDRILFDGFYPPGMWPLGAPVTEDFQVRLPSSLKEGTYEIQLKLVTDSLLPNFYVRDFLYNEDSFSSVSCARILVRAAIAR